MTYCHPYNSTQVYEFTAFLGSDLLTSSDLNLSCGDSFTMPYSATVCIRVTDNDSTLSGDASRNERGDDRSFQIADILVDGTQTETGTKIYAEEYYVLHGDDGRCYYLVEIERVGSEEGDNDDYFAFVGSIPDPSTTLTVAGKGNVCGNWIDYRDLSAGLKWSPDSNGKITIEAEDMALTGYKVDDVHAASGGEVIRLKRDTGEAQLTFGAEAGTYLIEIGYIDECDGEGQIEIWLNDTLLHTIELVENNNGNGNDWSTISTAQIPAVSLSSGDIITLRGVRDAWEMARIDAISFCPVEENAPPVAVDDFYEVAEQSVTVLDLLENDFDPDNDDLTLTLLTQPLEGAVSVDQDGQILFTTGDDFRGLSDGQTATVSFEYQISDGEASATATATITVVGEGTCVEAQSVVQDVTTLATGDVLTTSFFTPESIGCGTDDFSVSIAFGEPAADRYNFVYVVDVSSSTAQEDSFDIGKTVLDAEVEALKALTKSILDAGLPEGAATISIIPFSSPDAFPGPTFPVYTFGETSPLSQTEINAALDALTPAGETNYLAAIAQTTETIVDLEQRLGDGINQVYFLSDGDPTPPGSQPPFVLDIFSADLRAEASVHAVGLGTDVSETYLNPMDNTGGAEIVTDTQSLLAAVSQSPDQNDVVLGGVLTLSDEDGVAVDTFEFGRDSMDETPIGYTISFNDVSGLGQYVSDQTTADLSVFFDNDGDGVVDETSNFMVQIDGILPDSFDVI